MTNHPMTYENEIEQRVMDYYGIGENAEEDCVAKAISALKNSYAVNHFEYEAEALKALGVDVTAVER